MSVALEVRGLVKRYGTHARPAVDAVSFAVRAGTICALLGPSGAGKSTLLRVIAGFERADAGSVVLGERVLADEGTWLAPEERGIGFVHQSGALFPHLTVRSNVVFGLRSESRAARSARWQELADLCGLAAFAGRYPHELSGGEQQRVALARALARRTDLVLLDEPLSNVDPLHRTALGEDVRRILEISGTTAVLVTHDQEEAFALADQVGLLREGSLVQLDTPERVYREPASPFVADFLGHATFLPGRADDSGIATEIGVFDASRAHPRGAPVDVLIRPGDCLLDRDADGGAIVESAAFAGEHWIYGVTLASGRRLRCDIDAVPHAPLHPGDRVRVVPRSSHAVAFLAPER
ncbi:MAG TPA: ABC transporter ATP-binding protein [Gemmatimonadaceae bacterium]|nr:ABC transporter ATP-binding protein [Gemmatimonadaceae bacterium]